MYKQPVLIFGRGIQECRRVSIDFAEQIGYPVCLTWGAADLLPHDHPLRVGTFGTHGNRFANLAIQNADYVLSIGSRLDTKATGFPVSSFAPKAKLVMVDIDKTEIEKFKHLGREVEGVCAYAREYMQRPFMIPHGVDLPDLTPWKEQIEKWKAEYPVDQSEPYLIVEALSEMIQPEDIIVSDTGCVLGWMMQAFKFRGQRFVHAFNNTPMGYGLPAAIGVALGTGKRVVLVTGDGGLAVNITEMATVARQELPIKILLFNNRGHAMCRQTQRQWLNGEYPATSEEGGLACPDYTSVVRGYGIPTWQRYTDYGLRAMFNWHGPTFMNADINPDHGIVGQIKFGEALA